MITLDLALVTGLGLGLRHAADPDHLATVGSLLDEGRGLRGTLRVALWWGLGHALSFFLVGTLIVLAAVDLPDAFRVATEAVVAVTLVASGAWQLRSLARRDGTPAGAVRPVTLGLLHGLAGSASLGVACATTAGSAAAALGSLFLFGVGSIAGMCAVTWLVAGLARRALRRHGDVLPAVRLVSSVASVLLGLVVAHHLLTQHGGA